MSRLLFCLSLLFTCSLSVGDGALPGNSFSVNAFSVLIGSDGCSDVSEGADADQPMAISANPYNHRIDNGQSTALILAHGHFDSHPDIYPIRAPPV